MGVEGGGGQVERSVRVVSQGGYMGAPAFRTR